MELKGTVLNVVDFGAFVDIGLKDSGLVHISQMANRYIKSPHDVVSVGDVVTVWVMGVDGERKRVSLTMVKPGTERPRGNQGGGGGPPRPRRAPRRGRATSRRLRAVPLAAKARRLPSPPARASRWETPRRGGPIVPRAEAGRGPVAEAPAVRDATRGDRAAVVLATSTAEGPARGARARTGALRSNPAPSTPRPSRQARASAAPTVEGRVDRLRPAPDLRPAQAVVAGPRRRAR